MKTSKLISIVLIAAFVLTLSSTAFGTDADWDFNMAWKSAYVAPTGTNVHNDPVIQTTATATHEDYPGWFAYLWYNGELGSRFFDRKNGWATETNYGIGYANDWFEWIMAYWDCGDNFDNEDDILYNSFKISHTIQLENGQTITPYVNLGSYLLIDGADNGDGIAVLTGVYHGLPISDKIDMVSEATLIWGDGVLYTDTDSYMGKIGTRVNWQLDNDRTISIGPDYYFPISNLDDGRGEEFILNIGISW